MAKKQQQAEKIDWEARKTELRKMLGNGRSLKGSSARIDPNRLVKVTLLNGSSFWDHPIRQTATALEFDKMGLIPREQVKRLYFWTKPTDKEAFKAAVAKNDTPHFSTQNWVKELGGK